MVDSKKQRVEEEDPLEPLEQRIRKQEQALIFEHGFTAIGAGFCVLMALRLYNWTDSLGPLQSLWFFVLLTFLLGRLCAVFSYRSSKTDASGNGGLQPYSIYCAATVGEAFVWGASMSVIFPPEPLGQAFLLIVLIAVAVGAMASFAGSYLLYATYAVIIHVSVILKLMTIHDSTHLGIAVLTPVLLILLLVVARQMHNQMIHVMRLSIKNEQLALIESASKDSILHYGERLTAQNSIVEKISAENRALRRLVSQDLRSHFIALHQASRYLKEAGSSPYDQQTLLQEIHIAAAEGLRLVDQDLDSESD